MTQPIAPTALIALVFRGFSFHAPFHVRVEGFRIPVRFRLCQGSWTYPWRAFHRKYWISARSAAAGSRRRSDVEPVAGDHAGLRHALAVVSEPTWFR